MPVIFLAAPTSMTGVACFASVTGRLKRATHDRANEATKKWLNQSFGEGYFLPFFDLVFNDCFCLFERGFGVR